MAKYKVVHYINQFFAGIGGEEKADHMPEVRQGAVGPGRGLQAALGSDYEIAATVICGDNYFGENLDAATDTVIEMVKKYGPDVFVAGPAFNAGRYGVACGTICKAVEERLMIPVITGMYEENPGVDMFRKDLLIVSTPNSAAGMPKVLPVISALVKKLAQGQEILGPSEEGYLERGIRVNYGYDPERDEDNPSGSVFCAHGAGFVVSWDHVKEYMHMDSGIFKENQGTGPEVFKGPAKNAPEGSVEGRNMAGHG